MAEELNNNNEQFLGIIEPVEIDHEMRTAYIDYSMSVIVSRMSGTDSSLFRDEFSSEWMASD